MNKAHLLGLHGVQAKAYDLGFAAASIGATRAEMVANLEASQVLPNISAVRLRALLAPTDDAARAIILDALDAERAKLQAQMAPLDGKIRSMGALQRGMEDATEWLKGPLILQHVATSEFHRISGENILGRHLDGYDHSADFDRARGASLGVFLMRHNWGALLQNAQVDDGSVRLPFDFNCFEMEVSGRRVCALMACEDGEPDRLTTFIRSKGGWVHFLTTGLSSSHLVHVYCPTGGEALADLIERQVRAVAIMLDAGVVTSAITRAPHRSNAAVKRGAQPPYDHHTLSLVRPARRPLPLARAGAATHHKRLHFRRGHWRHYQTHKTWIRWCLVGDPSLGFSDKDYSL